MEGQARRTEYAVTDDRMFLCAIHTTHSDSQSIACWPFLNRDSRLHLLNFLFRQFSQRIISRLQERNDTRIPQREKTHLSGMSVGPQASFDVVMLPCPLFCLLQFLESGVDVFDRLYSVPAPLRSSVLKLAFCGM